MSFIQIIVLAVVQGITEFLPISSSGHLILGSWLFNWPDQGLFFDAAVHVGTLVAVLAYFRREWIQLATGLAGNGPVEIDDVGGGIRARSLAILIVAGTVPLVVFGPFIKDVVESDFRDPTAVGWLLIGTALALSIGEYFSRKIHSQQYGLGAMKTPQGFTIGLIQTFAVFPGISRSGVTMIAGMTLGLSRQSAARFSMLLATPAIAGAGVLVAMDALDSSENVDLGAAGLGAVISAFTAYFVISGLMRLLRNGSFRPFIAYCAVAGIAVVIARAAGA
ncbi:MAG: undecaprenyl-diphosphate phosphatase [Chloroflexi bacterium]|jgi:undecaprenyl-diphosphatase|nr:undecaprenyl-diphosphate phosphatase [Chloroflexota bacterium]MBT3862683.1 undecaprenyl-diphosphate phosphatase [Chloroflexota bacterium]MBT4142320.1 undecaprenyl-diphosphate phosphatase [Chloroflexota bacterium]MBT4943651.1 undecaprenyl-diphosphate phosphatase [Chloroflexota bacterium]MBT5252321.1 undecaprenyl-diphosphate phosphatase [Chloroflexota bacterium]